ncbi:MAG: 3-dehydroquinate synthase [Akkermansiaceae bacterium]|nr:3-dehydroquinate synthase [Akkermansiaceae bacterium]
MPTIVLSLGKRSYEIHAANASLDRLGAIIHRHHMEGRAALVTDSNVAPLFADNARHSLEEAGYNVSLHVIDAGEASKSLPCVEQLASELAAHGHDRTSFIVALGGGVVGDLAGFAAATYYRGIPFVQVPTTVMAQVDSSVGGKTAVNISAGKNLVGAFHQPALVVIDPTTLATLPPRIVSEGMAEMVKHAAIRDPEMLSEFAGLSREIELGFSLATMEKLPALLARNVAIKARIVEEDERETTGVRAFLNFGHTIGHGIEASLPYGALLHGEAVSLGMRSALALSERRAGLAHAESLRILRVLHELGLPLTLPEGIRVETVLEKTAADKKFRGGAIRFVLLKAPGEPVLSGEVTQDDLREAVELLKTQPFV